METSTYSLVVSCRCCFFFPAKGSSCLLSKTVKDNNGNPADSTCRWQFQRMLKIFDTSSFCFHSCVPWVCECISIPTIITNTNNEVISDDSLAVNFLSSSLFSQAPTFSVPRCGNTEPKVFQRKTSGLGSYHVLPV